MLEAPAWTMPGRRRRRRRRWFSLRRLVDRLFAKASWGYLLVG